MILQWWNVLLVMVAKACRHSGAETKGWWEYLEKWLEWKDTSMWVSIEEMPCVVEWDMEELVVVKQVEQVESIDWIGRSEESDLWVPLTGSSYKVQAENQ